MVRTLSLAALAAAASFAADTSRGDVIPFTSTFGYSYTSDGSAVSSQGSHYETGADGQAVDQSQTFSGGSSNFAARADRNGSQVSLGARAWSSGAPTGQGTYVGGAATYAANVAFTPSGLGGVAPTTANFQIALDGTLDGGDKAWFSLFNNGAGIFASGAVDDLWTTGHVTHNLEFVANSSGGYDVDGVVNFPVALTAGADGVLNGLMQLSLTAGASTVAGVEALADFMETATLIGVTFPELGDASAESLGWSMDFSAILEDVVAFNDRGPREVDGPSSGGSPTPEPASLLVWGVAACVVLRRRKRATSLSPDAASLA
jgi:hypothetical protein